MPLLSEFNGIKVYIYWDDHLPPHVHAEYSSFIALIDIQNCVILKGMFPLNKAKLILGWCELHKAELMQAWDDVKNRQMPKKIMPF